MTPNQVYKHTKGLCTIALDDFSYDLNDGLDLDSWDLLEDEIDDPVSLAKKLVHKLTRHELLELIEEIASAAKYYNFGS